MLNQRKVQLLVGTILALVSFLPANQILAEGTPALAEGVAVRAPASAGTASNKPVSAKTKQKFREGSRLEDIQGRFDYAAEQMTFYPAGESDSFRVLENLSAERIWQTSQDSNRLQEWVVSGTVTEFRGANYLLVTKAIIRTEANSSGLGKP